MASDPLEIAFLGWMDQVDATLLTEADMDSTRLPDQEYWDWFSAGISPREAALRTICNTLNSGP